MQTGAPGAEAAETGALTTQDAADAFLKGLLPEEEEATEGTEEAPEEEEEEETDEVSAEDEESEEGDTETESEDEAEDEEAPEGEEAPAEVEVEITVGDETRKVKVSEVARLVQAEAEITKTAQETATIREAAEQHSTKVAATLDRLLKSAEARYKPYAEIDMLLASRTMDAEAFAQLRKDAAEAFADYQFITSEVDGFISTTQEQQKATLAKQAEEAVKVLKADIPDWSDALYNDIRAFAVSKGMPAAVVNNMVDPTAIKIINMARMYEKSEQAKKTAAAKVQRKVAAPKKVLKTSTPAKASDASETRKADALKKLKNTGTIDSAADAFLARWAD